MQKNMQALDYAFLRRRIYEYKDKYPFAGYSVCARSWSGRALFTLSLGNTKEPALYIAGVRSGNTACTQVLLRFFERLCECVDTRGELAGIKINDVLNSFKGKYIQEVPLYSSVKVNGKKLYEYAREGVEVEIPPREIEVFDIK